MQRTLHGPGFFIRCKNKISLMRKKHIKQPSKLADESRKGEAAFTGSRVPGDGVWLIYLLPAGGCVSLLIFFFSWFIRCWLGWPAKPMWD